MNQGRSPASVVSAMRQSAGGWWSARPSGELLALYTISDDTYYRAHHAYVTRGNEPSQFDSVRAVYFLGHLAGLNPDYLGREWLEVEQDLAIGWGEVGPLWSDVSHFAQAGFARAASAREDAWRARLAESDEAWNAA